MAAPARLDAEKVAAARLWAAARYPYLASALFSTTVVSRPGMGGAAVDEWWRLYVDPAAVAGWSVEVLGSVMVHHTGHLLRDHSSRARNAGVRPDNAKDWRNAADAEINDDLVGTGLRLPGEPLVPQSLGYQPGQLAEDYFHGQGRKRPTAEDCGSGSDSIVREWEITGEEAGGMPPGARHLIQCQVASEVLRHAQAGRGRVPSTWTRWAEELLQPKVDWRKVLAAEIRKGLASVTGKVDYSYRRPSRRASVSPDVILPSLERPVPEIAIVCDTSGSMSDEQLGTVLVEVEGLLRAVGVARASVRVLAVDAAVQSVRRVSSARQVDLVGGGGTDMGVGIAAAARLRPRPSVMVVLTDGLSPWPAEPPRGVEVVVGLIKAAVPAGGPGWDPPAWARVVDIDPGD